MARSTRCQTAEPESHTAPLKKPTATMLLQCAEMQSTPPAAVSSSLDAVGNTPLLRLAAMTDATCADVYVKLESFNPTASYKDRMARALIERAEEREQLRPGMSVVEYSGGSTGSSLAFVCAVKGYPLTIVSSDAFAEEKLKTMRAFGANVVIIPSQGGAITGDLIAAMRARAKSRRTGRHIERDERRSSTRISGRTGARAQRRNGRRRLWLEVPRGRPLRLNSC